MEITKSDLYSYSSSLRSVPSSLWLIALEALSLKMWACKVTFFVYVLMKYARPSSMPIPPTALTSLNTKRLTCQHTVYYSWELLIKVPTAPVWPHCFLTSSRFSGKQIMLSSSRFGKIRMPFSDSFLSIYRSVQILKPSFFTKHSAPLWSMESNYWWVSTL